MRWSGEPLDDRPARRLLSAVLVRGRAGRGAARRPVLRRTIRRIGLLDRTAVFDEDDALHDRIETILGALGAARRRRRARPARSCWRACPIRVRPTVQLSGFHPQGA